MIKNKRVLYILITLLTVGLIFYTALYYYIPYNNTKNKLTVEFIATGKSDSIFIKLPNQKTVLIDGGFASSLPQIHSTLHKNRVRKIDFLIATHQHDDHIGSFTDILKIYDTEKIYMPASPIKNGKTESLEKKIKEMNIPVYNAKHGDILIDENDILLKVLSPFSEDIYTDENDYSLVLYLSYKDTSFLFMGDATKRIEGLLMNYYEHELEEADVIKLGHHGSDTSSSYPFLEKINPRFCVATTDDNEESKLSDNLINTLDKLGIKLFSTNKDGSITFISNGKNIEIKTEK